jgi:hypothetical protein
MVGRVCVKWTPTRRLSSDQNLHGLVGQPYVLPNSSDHASNNLERGSGCLKLTASQKAQLLIRYRTDYHLRVLHHHVQLLVHHHLRLLLHHHLWLLHHHHLRHYHLWVWLYRLHRLHRLSALSLAGCWLAGWLAVAGGCGASELHFYNSNF